jgi:uncharacterized damage-inducible protein DinB
MREVDRIKVELRNSLEGNAWHGPSILEVLLDVTVDMARARPIPKAHSIWELVLHITTWVRAGVSGAMGKAIEVPDEVDWRTPDEETSAAWEEALCDLKKAHGELDDVLSNTSDEKLAEVVPGKGYTVYKLVHGVVQHNLYHAGQIAILKKL